MAANWTVSTLLDMVQELLGEPVGGFYNISTRLQYMNQAQREMNEETRALTASSDISVTSGTRDYSVPADFQTFAQEAPFFKDLSGNRTRLNVVSPSDLDARFDHWQDDDVHEGDPAYVLLRNGTLPLHPTPDTSGTITLPYLVEPDELVDMDDVPFNGLSRYNRFSPALAYKVAFIQMIGRAPQVAAMFRDLYERELREMRHYVRTNPQNHLEIRPTPREE
jgi:hypothetical protein